LPCAIIIHGEIGAGKTRTALALAERARSMGLRL
jgi:deoxyadenosine/deoxycytidine kinase